MASVWEGTGSCGGTVAWGLVVVVLVEVGVEAVALQTEGDRCWGPLWSRVNQDLQYRYKKNPIYIVWHK